MPPPVATSSAAAAPPLRPRRDRTVPERLARSAATTEGAHLRTGEFAAWLAERHRAHRFRVRRIPFAELDGWSFDPETGDLGHRSGRFFTVEGLRATTPEGPFGSWDQPIIRQPEVGILGILVKEFDGVLHCLMQAKMEPGNPNLLQLSPTVQATRSNYTRVHRGTEVKYVEYFTRPGRGRVLADALQSEHGSWFLRKANRNMIVEAVGEVPLDEDFCWLTFGQIAELLHRDNVVNMDARTVLACAPFPRPETGALHTDTEVLSWLTAARSTNDLRAERIPLSAAREWRRDGSAISREDGRYFSVVAVSVEADNREVSSWTQPLFAPHGQGVTAFLVRRVGGVTHVLAHARAEAGFVHSPELGPTVQYTPDNYAHLTGDQRPPFLDLVLSAPAARIRYEAVHAEEGGRFLRAESRYLLVDADDAGLPPAPPPGYRWVTPGQLTSLVRHGHYVNVQARTLLACLNATEGSGR